MSANRSHSSSQKHSDIILHSRGLTPDISCFFFRKPARHRDDLPKIDKSKQSLKASQTVEREREEKKLFCAQCATSFSPRQDWLTVAFGRTWEEKTGTGSLVLKYLLVEKERKSKEGEKKILKCDFYILIKCTCSFPTSHGATLNYSSLEKMESSRVLRQSRGCCMYGPCNRARLCLNKR